MNIRNIYLSFVSGFVYYNGIHSGIFKRHLIEEQHGILFSQRIFQKVSNDCIYCLENYTYTIKIDDISDSSVAINNRKL